MSDQSTGGTKTKAVPTAPTAMQQWFPIGSWLPKYNWGRYLAADLIAAVSVAALLIPESMGYSSVAGVPVQIGLSGVTGEIGEHRIYDTVRDAVGAATSDPERENSR